MIRKSAPFSRRCPTSWLWADDFEGAERTAREAVRIYRAVPEHHPDRVMADYFLADILLLSGADR